MASPPRIRLTAESAPEAPAWWKERVMPLIQRGLADTGGALDGKLTLGENLACAVSEVRVKMPATQTDTPISARYTKNSAQTYTNNADTFINYETETFDAHGAVSDASTAWRFTCPVGHAGTYLVQASTLYGGLGGVNGDIRLFVTKTTAAGASSDYGLAIDARVFGGWQSLKGVTLVDLAEGDYVRVKTWQVTGADRAVQPDTNFNHVDIAEQTNPARVTPSCFPVPYQARLSGKGFKPKLVLVGNIRDGETGGAPVLSGALGSPIWDWDGKDMVRLLDLPGLSYGRSYDVTLVTFAG